MFMARILITGAGSGIGRATAFALARRGHEVLATCRMAPQAADLAGEAHTEKVILQTAVLDITVPADRLQIETFAPDVFIANAAVGESGSLAEIPLDRVVRLFETNVVGTLGCIQEAAKGMVARKAGRVIVTSSLAGRLAIPYMGAYCMTKHAVEAMGDVLRMELGRHGVSVSLIEPGLIYTGFNERMAASKYEWMQEDSIDADLLPSMRRRDEALPSHSYTTDSVVRAMVHAVESRYPKARYITPKSYRPTIFLEKFLPTFIKDWIMSGYVKG